MVTARCRKCVVRLRNLQTPQLRGIYLELPAGLNLLPASFHDRGLHGYGENGITAVTVMTPPNASRPHLRQHLR